MTSSSHLSARLDALVERLTSCPVPTPTALALEAAAELLAIDAASKKGARNKVLTELFWVGKNGKELSPEGKKRAIKDLKESGAVHETKGGKLKLTKQGVQDFAAISKKKAELVEKGVRRFASVEEREALQASFAERASRLMAALPLPPGFTTKFGSESKSPRESGTPWAEKETARVLSTLERGDIVKVGSSKWAVFRKNDNTSVTAYKWPSKKTKIYFIRLEEDAATLGDNVVVYPVGGSGQRIGPDVAKGALTPSSVQRKGADLDASVSAAGNRDSAVVVTIPIPDKYARRFPDPVTANHGHAPHMTLLFVGTKDYQPGEMSQILTTLRAACQKVPPFRLYVDPNAGLQDFGPNEEKGEKALWLPARAEPRGEAERLHRVMRMALEQEGIEVGAHDSFKPHVTWSYVPNDQPEQERHRMNAAVSDRFKEGFYFDVRHIMLSMPDGSSKALALSPLPRKK